MSTGSLILIGFMGAGKTSVGTRYAEKKGLSFSDTDILITEKEGMDVSRIFQIKGEQAFRQAETALLKQLLASGQKGVLSVGGGLPMKSENRELLRALGTVVYLCIQPDTVLRRLAGDSSRPLLAGGDKREKVEKLMQVRDPVYRETAHRVLHVDHKDYQTILGELDLIWEEDI